MNENNDNKDNNSVNSKKNLSYFPICLSCGEIIQYFLYKSFITTYCSEGYDEFCNINNIHFKEVDMNDKNSFKVNQKMEKEIVIISEKEKNKIKKLLKKRDLLKELFIFIISIFFVNYDKEKHYIGIKNNLENIDSLKLKKDINIKYESFLKNIFKEIFKYHLLLTNSYIQIDENKIIFLIIGDYLPITLEDFCSIIEKDKNKLKNKIFNYFDKKINAEKSFKYFKTKEIALEDEKCES